MDTYERGRPSKQTAWQVAHIRSEKLFLSRPSNQQTNQQGGQCCYAISYPSASASARLSFIKEETGKVGALSCIDKRQVDLKPSSMEVLGFTAGMEEITMKFGLEVKAVVTAAHTQICSTMSKVYTIFHI